MKIALVHDYLNQYGGGERVLEALMEMFPSAPVYTLLYDETRTHGRFAGKVKKTSFLNFPLARKKHRLFIPLMPTAASSINLGDTYDLVISDTAGYAKGIRYGARTKHVSYIHTPLRYAWETDAYFSSAVFKGLFRPVFRYLRNWDYRAAQKPHILIANSEFIAKKIRHYYGRDARVIYPPVDTEKFFYDPKSYQLKAQSYYLAVGRLLHYKRFDLVAQVFANLGLPLKIVGSGPEEERIKNQVSRIKNIELIPFVKDDAELRALYSGAKALIFPQVEDFGLVAAEAQACGCPVIAYAAGGAMEIVQNKKTGLLFHQQTPHALIGAIRDSESMRWNRAAIARFTKQFSKQRFQKEFTALLSSL